MKLKQFSKSFPVNENEHNMVKRNGNKYVTVTERILNENFHENRKEFQKIMKSGVFQQWIITIAIPLGKFN